MYVDVIIPTYKPGKQLIELIEKLETQSVLPFRIILINTVKEYFEKAEGLLEIVNKYSNIKVIHIEKSEFNHGGSRNKGASYSDADFLLFMTNDAIPKDKNLIQRLLSAMEDEKVAAAYARQCPAADAGAIEIFGREFNYPDKSSVKSKDDIQRLGIKTFFCSDVCAMYRGDIFRARGGFNDNMIFNEDMLYAGNLVLDGYKVAYCADACVIHSHNYTAMQQFHRNFDLGVSQADHPEVFAIAKSEGEGMKLVKGTIKYLVKNGKIYLVPYFCINCAFKLAGYKLGKNYKKLPQKLIMKFTSNKEYWRE